MIGSLLDKLKSGAGAQVSPRQSLLAFLKQFNCKYEHTKTNENIDEYYFSYQHGNFIAFVYQNEQVVEVIFPRVFETTIEHLNLVFTFTRVLQCKEYSRERPCEKHNEQKDARLHINQSS